MEKKIRILYVMHSMLKGGAERLVLDICNELNNRTDVEYLLLTMIPDNEFPSLSEKVHYQLCTSYVHLSITGKKEVDLSHYSAIVEKFQPHVIHSHLYAPEILTREKLYPGIAYLSHLHDNMKQFRGWEWPVTKQTITDYYEKHLLINKYRQCNNHFIAISRDTETYFKQKLPDKLAANIILLPNAINFNRFNAFRNGISPSKNETVKLITVGNLIPRKNQALSIDITEQLIKSGIKAELHLLGDGQERTNLEKLARDKNISQQIIFHGKVEQVEKYLAEAHIYLHTAIHEPFGLVLLEAMAAGLPVISLDGGGNQDIVINDHNGYLLRETNPVAYVEKILTLINDENEYQRLSANAISFSAKYDIKDYCDNLLNIYRKVIKLNT